MLVPPASMFGHVPPRSKVKTPTIYLGHYRGFVARPTSLHTAGSLASFVKREVIARVFQPLRYLGRLAMSASVSACQEGGVVSARSGRHVSDHAEVAASRTSSSHVGSCLIHATPCRIWRLHQDIAGGPMPSLSVRQHPDPRSEENTQISVCHGFLTCLANNFNVSRDPCFCFTQHN